MVQYYNNTLEKLGQERIAVGWPWRLFLFSFLVATAAAVIYAGLAFGYRPFLDVRLQQIDDDIEKLGQAVPEEELDGLLTFYSQLANLQGLLSKHLLGSQVFPLLERNTHQSVAYTTAELKLNEGRLFLEGVAPSYLILSQQLEAFDRLPEVAKVVVSNSHVGDGRIFFRLTLLLKEKVFR